MGGLGRVLLSGLLLCGAMSVAEEPWKVVVQGPVVVKSRPFGGGQVHEVWAEGDFNVPVKALQETLLDVKRLPQYMPYVQEARELARSKDGSRYVYARLKLPWVTARDYVLHMFVDQRVQASGLGSFASHWKAEPDKFPKRPHTVRMTLNEGSWVITPLSEGRSHAVYKFVVDPGGWLPGFALESAQKSAALATFHAVGAEAQRRAGTRISCIERCSAQRSVAGPL